MSEQAAQLSTMYQNRDDEGLDEYDCLVKHGGTIWSNFTMQDLRHEEEEVRLLEEKKRVLEERLSGLERDLGGLMR